jgi:EAL domain-containing protein (putative c-di-GMP-specific phosphodiesterase class I)
MNTSSHGTSSPGCARCRDTSPLPFEFTMAFQPIVDLQERRVFAWEALVRGLNGEGAATILAQVTDENRYAFDQACRTRAIELAARLGIEEYVSINFLPNAVYRPETCIRKTLAAAEQFDFPTDRIIFEVTESEQVMDRAHLRGIFEEYNRLGFRTAIDDFGAGYAGLNLLVEFQPHLLKLDMELVRDIHRHQVRQTLVRSILDAARGLDISVIAEGVETREELIALQAMGVRYIQGYWFAHPSLEAAPPVADDRWPPTAGEH